MLGPLQSRPAAWVRRLKSLMAVKMMHVRHVRMRVRQPRVPMGVSVRLPGRIGGAVLMAMIFVVSMWVCVHRLVMNVLMLMPFGEVQPDAQPHQPSPRQQIGGHRLSKSNDSGQRAKKNGAVEK
jgi:hypothetical protein